MATAKKFRVPLWFCSNPGQGYLHPMLEVKTVCSSCWRAESLVRLCGWFCPLLWQCISSWCSHQIHCISCISLDEVMKNASCEGSKQGQLQCSERVKNLPWEWKSGKRKAIHWESWSYSLWRSTHGAKKVGSVFIDCWNMWKRLLLWRTARGTEYQGILCRWVRREGYTGVTQSARFAWQILPLGTRAGFLLLVQPLGFHPSYL